MHPFGPLWKSHGECSVHVAQSSQWIALRGALGCSEPPFLEMDDDFCGNGCLVLGTSVKATNSIKNRHVIPSIGILTEMIRETPLSITFPSVPTIPMVPIFPAEMERFFSVGRNRPVHFETSGDPQWW